MALLEASNLRLVSEKEETQVVDMSDVVKELKKAVRDSKKKEKDASETISRLQATIETLKAQVVDEGSAVKPRIKKESVQKPPKNAVKGKKAKGQQVIEDECGSADSVSSPESQKPVSKRKRTTKKNQGKEAELSPADESSVEGLINYCNLLILFVNTILINKYIFSRGGEC